MRKRQAKSWRDQILKEFAPQVAQLTVVADPDGLLTEEGVWQELQKRGFDLLLFDDPIAFRFVYESKYRSRWDRGEGTELIVVSRSRFSDIRVLPYDLLATGRQLSFNLGELFPNLSYPVVQVLDHGELDALYQAQLQHNPEPLGENATKDFVLRHVFEIVPELVKQPSDLLRVLLRRHHQGQRIPVMLDDRFIKILRQRRSFEAWPLERIVPDRQAFFAFLQERWPRFVHRLLGKKDSAYNPGRSKDVAEPAMDSEIEAPLDLPFEHDDVRVYVDNLFLEGFLHPIDVSEAYSEPQDSELLSDWISFGIHLDPVADQIRRLERLLQTVGTAIPQPEARHQDWLTFAYRWAELSVLWHRISHSKQTVFTGQFQSLQEDVDTRFFSWIQDRYGSLHNLPASPPVMLHHIPRYLAQAFLAQPRARKVKHAGKVALLLLDGLALDQWLVLRDVLGQQRPHLRVREESIFAWLPTLTSVSRQSVFAGKPPIYYPASIQTTDKEAALWRKFWADYGLQSTQVAYAKSLGEEETLSKVEELLSHPKVQIVGLIIDTIDKIMHGMQLGTAGMHNQVQQWAEQGFLGQLLDLLLEQKFNIVLTSDHGNIEAEGCGRPSEGAVADLRGERVRVYSNQSLRAQVNERFTDAIAWPPLGLPEDYLSLFAAGRTAFVQNGERIVGHGGISLEELIVPFVAIEQ